MLISLTSIIFGLMLRLSLDYKENRLTWKNSFINAIASISTCYVFYLIRRDYKWAISLDLMLFIVSLFASFLVSLIDKFGKFGIKNYFLMFIRRYAAEAELDNPEENHGQDNTTVH